MATISEIIAQLLGQQGPQAITIPQPTLGREPQQPDTGILPPGMLVPPLVPRSVTPGSMLPGAGPVQTVPPRAPQVPQVSDARPRLPGTGTPDTLTGDPVRIPFGPPSSMMQLPSADSLMSGIRSMGELPGSEAVGPFTTEVQPEPQNPGPDADAIVHGAQAAAAARGQPAATPATPTGRQPRGFGDYALAFLSGLSGEGGLNAVRRLSEGERGQNATYNALVQRGASPELAEAITLNPAQFGSVLPSLFTPNTVVVNNRLVNKNTGQVIADLSDRFIALPEGAGVLNQATGAATPGTGANRQERARQTAVGKAQGEAQAALPSAIQSAENALNIITKLRNHPGRQFATGMTGVVPGIPGTQQRDFITILDQAKGQAFLEAYQGLRGGGQITEVEGKKATDAIARLERTQSEAGFLEALNDLEGVIRRGVANARARAGQTGGTGAPGTTAGSGGTWTDLGGGIRIRERQ